MAIIRTQVISVSEGGLAGETPRNIVGDIEGNTEKGLDVIEEMAFVSDLFHGYFEIKPGENQVQAQTANSFKVQAKPVSIAARSQRFVNISKDLASK